MDAQNRITLAAASDNNYAILLSALLKSVEINHVSGEPIDFYIIDDGISARNKKRIESQINPAVMQLHWRKTEEIVPDNIKIPLDSSTFPTTTYMRVFAPLIVPDSVHRLIYLDVDMIVRKDISQLWNTPLQGKTIGAVIDLAEVVSCSWSGISNYKELGLDPDTKYFNAGLMVVDVTRWKERDVINRFMTCMHENVKKVKMADQYGLNVVLVNDWQELDRPWNTFSVLDKEDPFVIHYLDIKPIFKSYSGNKRYQTEFYTYLRQTPWKRHRPIGNYRRISWKVKNKLTKAVKGLLQS
jgi:lipopolysaccharide biosynthesis glycosyltransferase